MAILCLCCGLASANPHDIEQLYCGLCSAYHSEWRDESDEVWKNGEWVRPGVHVPRTRGDEPTTSPRGICGNVPRTRGDERRERHDPLQRLHVLRRAGMNRVLGRDDLAGSANPSLKDCHHDPLQRMPHHV